MKHILCGNPNVGKTTFLNSLTGQNEHVGNWHGVTTDVIEKTYQLSNKQNSIIDLPGLYSLSCYSFEEEIARDYIFSNEYNIINLVDCNNMARSGQGMLLRIVVRCHADGEHAAGGEAAGADIAAAVHFDHAAVAFIRHFKGVADAVLDAERVERKPYVAAGIEAELAHHGQIAHIRPEHHTSAVEIQYGALGRLLVLLRDQARKAVHIDHPVKRLMVLRIEYASIPIHLRNGLFKLILRQPKSLLRAGDLIPHAKHRSKQTHDIFSFTTIFQNELAMPNRHPEKKPRPAQPLSTSAL